MMSQRSSRAALAFLVVSGVLIAPASVWAASTCTANSDCPKGFACQTAGATACPAIACAPGETCPVCTPTPISECVSIPCNVDSDCASGMVCFSQTTDTCAGEVATTLACPPDTKCDPTTPAEPPPPCTATTTHTCVPKYVLPCHTASDCGSGFTCDPDTVGSCEGGGSVGSADGGPVPLPEPPVCTTTTLSTSHCSAIPTACDVDGDCPSSWTCEGVAVNASGIACGAPASIDGGPVEVDCGLPTTTPTAKQCVPPYYDLSNGSLGGADLSATGAAAPEVNGSAGDAGAVPAAESAPAAGAKVDSGSGGCAVGPGPAGSGAVSLLGWLGFVGLGLRRGRRRAASRD